LIYGKHVLTTDLILMNKRFSYDECSGICETASCNSVC